MREFLLETDLGDTVPLTVRDPRVGRAFGWASDPPRIEVEAHSAPDSNVIVTTGTGQIAPAHPTLAGFVWAPTYDRLLGEIAALRRLALQDARAILLRTPGRTLRLQLRDARPRGWLMPGRPEGASHVTPVTLELYAVGLEWYDLELAEYVGLIPL